MSVTVVRSNAELEARLGGHVTLLYFWAEWCEPCKHMQQVVQQLAESYPSLCCVSADAEEVDDVTDRFEVGSVPSFVLLKNRAVVDTLVGADASLLVNKVEAALREFEASPPPVDLNERLRQLTNFAPIMVFMKGTPDAPQCGFSRQIVGILKENSIPFSSFNILSDPDVRQGLKTFSNWPTYPQLYAQGVLVGGLDIVKELQEEGELVSTLQGAIALTRSKEKAKADTLNERLRELTHSAPVMLFMKGTPDAPQCGFSNKIVSILNNAGVLFSSFNILADPEVRQGLKEFSNWPTYPQLYAQGKLIGGLDIVKELYEEGELLDSIPAEARR